MRDVSDLREETGWRWRLEPRDGMRVPGIVFASRALLPARGDDRAVQQVADVATLPGIVDASYGMPDLHWGYGFPIGGVAATDVAAGGVVSPGGVGFDISCGVRLLAVDGTLGRLGPRLGDVMDALDRGVPRGVGPGGILDVGRGAGLDAVLVDGAVRAVQLGQGTSRDLDRCEDGGRLAGADPRQVGDRARRRGAAQVGSLGAGNHFLEVQVVDAVLDPAAATAFGLEAGQLCVMIHCGSRGLGHQVCSDHVAAMEAAMPAHGIRVPDPQLACAPVESPEGRAYLGAMIAAANYGRANRQLLTHLVRGVVRRTAGADVVLVYDVSHNLAKLEQHTVDGRSLRLCVHRKGATRALPPGHPDLPPDLRAVGQPVLVPGSMGTASWVLVGADPGGAFSSACHGAGRTLSRHAARRLTSAGSVRSQMAAAGIDLRGRSRLGVVEEAPLAYKDVDEVVRVTELAGLARRVARLRPVGVVKG